MNWKEKTKQKLEKNFITWLEGKECHLFLQFVTQTNKACQRDPWQSLHFQISQL
jgi:hypothetical protein